MAGTKRPMSWNAGAVITLVMCVGLLAVSVSLTIHEYLLGANGVPAVGTVTRYEKRGRSVHWTITYQHQAQTVSATVVPSMFSGLELGKQVAILYDPNDPKTINVDNFWHRYFYQTLGCGLAGLFLLVLRGLLWPSDDDWLETYSIKLCAAAGKDKPKRRADQLVLAVWQFNSAVGNRPRAAIAGYFETHGVAGWEALKALWDREKVPSLAAVVDEIEHTIADGNPVAELADASPVIEKFYITRRPAILRELRDYATAPESEPSAGV